MPLPDLDSYPDSVFKDLLRHYLNSTSELNRLWEHVGCGENVRCALADLEAGGALQLTLSDEAFTVSRVSPSDSPRGAALRSALRAVVMEWLAAELAHLETEAHAMLEQRGEQLAPPPTPPPAPEATAPSPESPVPLRASLPPGVESFEQAYAELFQRHVETWRLIEPILVEVAKLIDSGGGGWRLRAYWDVYALARRKKTSLQMDSSSNREALKVRLKDHPLF